MATSTRYFSAARYLIPNAFTTAAPRHLRRPQRKCADRYCLRRLPPARWPTQSHRTIVATFPGHRAGDCTRTYPSPDAGAALLWLIASLPTAGFRPVDFITSPVTNSGAPRVCLPATSFAAAAHTQTTDNFIGISGDMADIDGMLLKQISATWLVVAADSN